MDIAFLSETFMVLLGGLPLTLNLALTSSLIGLLGAIALALSRVSGIAILAWWAQVYVFVFRGTPLLGQFRPTLQEWGLWGMLRSPYWCAVIALAMNTAAYGSEIIRGGMAAVAHGAIEAANACGMGTWLRLRRVVFPLALRAALPAYGNELILMVKATSLASVITLMEVTGLAGKLIAQTYRSVEIFTCAGIIYLVLNFFLTRLVQVLEWKLSTER